MKEKSTFLKILPYLLVVLVIMVFAVVLFLFLRPGDAADAPPPQTDASETVTPPPAQGDAPPAPIQTPDDASVTAATTYAYGALRLDMPGELLLEENRDKTRVTVRLDTETLPRLDGQQLQAKQPTDEEYLRLAAGLLQAYYADPPETAGITVTPQADLPHAYAVETSARGETPAMTARVRFLQTGNELWYLILLSPAGEDPGAALTSVFETARMEG
ncbi:MAG: hypothetical protein HFF17_02495 [Oscillospiraceae bacterium]|nr:hypothetical protein [Oscillospiraceae bacterium]